MRNRINRIVRKLTVAAIISGLTAWLLLSAWRSPSSASAQTADRPSDALPALQGEQTIERLKEQGLYDSLQEAVAAARYELRWDDAPARGSLPPAYRAPNPAQQYDAYFTPNGLSLAPRKTAPNDAESLATTDETAHPTKAPEWQATMRLIGYGYGKSLVSVGFPELAAQGNRIEYRRAWPPLTEWYINKAAGLEQGFTIDTPPGIRSEGERLRLALEVTGDLSVELTEGGQAVALKQANGKPALSYSELHAYDAQGRALPSQMRVSEGQVILEVEDASAVYPVTIDPTFTQQAKLTASDGVANDNFGNSVAIYWNTAVVGVPYDDIDSNNDEGSAYVFVLNNGYWSQEAKLRATEGLAGDQFGSSVAIYSDTVVVGARYAFFGSGRQGSAYVFARSGSIWTQKAKLNANDWAGANFGSSVAIYSDTVVVGGAYQNSAYVFSGAAWSQQAKLTASNGTGSDEFGYSVSIGGYGNMIAVGAPLAVVGGVLPGSAYVFVRSGSTWTQQARLTASDGTDGDKFGFSVAISQTGNRLVVGAPIDTIGSSASQGSAYLFVRSNGFWSQSAKLTSDGGALDSFGSSVAISGYTVVVGASGDTTAANLFQGAAYVFVCNGACGAPQRLTASDGAGGDWFGSSVAIDPAGTDTVVVGAPGDDIPRWAWHNLVVSPNQGSAYVFIR